MWWVACCWAPRLLIVSRLIVGKRSTLGEFPSSRLCRRPPCNALFGLCLESVSDAAGLQPSADSKTIPKGIEGGLIGGLLAGVAHCIVASIFFTSSSGFTFIPEHLIERMVWAALCSTCIGLGLIYSIRTQSLSRRALARFPIQTCPQGIPGTTPKRATNNDKKPEPAGVSPGSPSRLARRAYQARPRNAPLTTIKT